MLYLFRLLPWLWQFLRHFLFLMTLIVIVLRNMGQIFCIISLNWDLSDVFLIARLGLWFAGGGKTTEVKYHSHQVISRAHHLTWVTTVDIDFHHLAELLFVGFSTAFPSYPVWNKVTLCHPHLKSGEWCSFWVQNIYLNYLEPFCIRDGSLLHWFIYSVAISNS